MAFTYYQTPTRLTPANAEHIYTIGSDLSGENSYKYVVNIIAFPYDWIDTDTYLIAKIKARPNSQGRFTFDAQKIIKSMLDPNIRVDWGNYLETNIGIYRGPFSEDSYMVSKPTLNEAFSRINANNNVSVVGSVDPNNFNGPFEAEVGMEAKYHLMEYRVMIGEEYYDTFGNYIQNGPELDGAKYVPVLDENVVPSDVGGYPAQFPSVYWSNFFGRYNLGTLVGINVRHTDNIGTVYEDRDIAGSSGWVSSIQTPLAGDFLYIKSLYSRKTWKFVWTTDPEALDPGWVFVDVTYEFPYWYGQFQPESIITWVGAQDRIQEDYYISQGVNFEGINSHLYDASRWWMHSKQSDVVRSPSYGKFLNIAGPSEDVDYPLVTIPTRRRTIYRGEPIMVSFFNGYTYSFLNDLRMLVFRSHSKNQAPGIFNYDFNYIINDNGAGPLENVSDPYPTYAEGDALSNKLLHFTKNDIWNSWDPNDPFEYFEINTWQYEQDPADGTPEYHEESASEILRLDVKDSSCFNKPTYFVFLNRNGAWDTFTFGAKTVKSYDIERKTYTKAPYRNGDYYIKNSYDQAKTVYENNITVGLTCETEYLRENDSVIVEDLIRSSQVYIVEDIFNDLSGNLVSPKLIPVTVLTSSVEEYQKRYEKLFQHTIEVEFNNIEGYNQSK